MDILKLEYEIKKRNHSIKEYYTAIGIGKSGYYRRKNGEVEFDRLEIEKTLDFLGIDSPMGIFF